MKEARNSAKQAVSDILRKFVVEADSHTIDAKYGPILEEAARRSFTSIGSRSLSSILLNSIDVDLGKSGQCVLLEVIERSHMFPLLLLRSSDRWVHFGMYMLLWQFDHCNEPQSLAIRFETDEGNPKTDKDRGAHDFCHAQLCRSIGRNLDATTPPWLPESQPSIPLDADDQVSLVLCTLVSLYGGRHVLNKLNDLGIQNRLETVRALKKQP